MLMCKYLGVQWLETSDQEDLLGSRTRIKAWVKAVENATNPEFNKVHSKLYEMAKKLHADREFKDKPSCEVLILKNQLLCRRLFDYQIFVSDQ